MSKNKVLIGIVLVVFLIVGGFAGWQVKAAFQRQLAAPLVIQTKPASTPLPASPASASQPEALAPTSTPAVSPAASPSKTCGQSGAMTVLVLARDISNGVPPYGADLIRFVRIDFDNQTVSLIAVPRDLWVSTPHLAPLNVTNSRLGLVYYLQEISMSGTTQQVATASTNAVAQALYDNFEVTADHYIFFEMRYFADAVDQLGGLDVNVPASMVDGQDILWAGPHHFDGTQALRYTRLLPVESELVSGWGWDRMDRQNLVLKALVAKLLEPANLVKVPGLIQQFQNDFTTDLSPQQITDLVCMAGKVPPDQVDNFEVDPGMILGPGPDNSMLPNTDAIKQFLQQQLAP